MNKNFTENQVIKYCKYCHNQLKEITYEIIELDKTDSFNRYYCHKCFRVFHFREPKIKVKKKVSKGKEEKTKKVVKKATTK